MAKECGGATAAAGQARVVMAPGPHPAGIDGTTGRPLWDAALDSWPQVVASREYKKPGGLRR